VGDSLSVPLSSPDWLDRNDRVAAQLAAVGVVETINDSTGGRSIVETVAGNPNAETGVHRLLEGGFDGCFLIAMGTNDAANHAVGSNVGPRRRIDRIMAAVGDRPVLWPTVRTTRTSGPYADAEMAAFNEALFSACADYPNLVVYDLASEAPDAWFQEDGIHLTYAGYAERARRFAVALARAFPAAGAPPAGCVVSAE
jgi:lysophospholipase L1-like esterase